MTVAITAPQTITKCCDGSRVDIHYYKLRPIQGVITMTPQI